MANRLKRLANRDDLLTGLKPGENGIEDFWGKASSRSYFRLRTQQSLTMSVRLSTATQITEFLSRLIYFVLFLIARPTRLQIHSAPTLPADVTVSSLRRSRN
ncbi:MAG TPA: hypothetical protein VIX17_06350 [Pyrinomonadaceae bacterium]|jgi:hypothetical protein